MTREDENALAPVLLRAVATILDVLPISYVLRIDTSDSHVYQQTNAKDAPQHPIVKPPHLVSNEDPEDT
jgi:hypothetical protein